MKEQLLQRIQDLRLALEQSANNHNALIGRMAEAQYLYDEWLKKKNEAEVEAKESDTDLDDINPA